MKNTIALACLFSILFLTACTHWQVQEVSLLEEEESKSEALAIDKDREAHQKRHQMGKQSKDKSQENKTESMQQNTLPATQGLTEKADTESKKKNEQGREQSSRAKQTLRKDLKRESVSSDSAKQAEKKAEANAQKSTRKAALPKKPRDLEPATEDAPVTQENKKHLLSGKKAVGSESSEGPPLQDQSKEEVSKHSEQGYEGVDEKKGKYLIEENETSALIHGEGEGVIILRGDQEGLLEKSSTLKSRSWNMQRQF